MAEQLNREPAWLAHRVQLDKPSAARVYDYLLGGYHNFEIDRRMADQFATIFPDLRLTARVNRAFLRRAALFVSRQGVDQFLDLGSGIPTVGNVHEIVREVNAHARTVYVDIDPTAIAHSEAILGDDPGVATILADVRRPNAVLDHPQTKTLIDFSRPVGLFVVALMHYILDDAEAQRVITAFKDALPSGSYLTIGVWTDEDAPRDVMEQYERMSHQTSTPGRPQSRTTVLSYFRGFELIEPGVVHSPSWRPDGPDDLIVDEPGRSVTWVGVARKP
jgi:hypothetical protein